MSFIFITVTAVAIRVVERVLFHVYKWQIKEYRWDRYRDYFYSQQGMRILFHPWYWAAIAIIILRRFAYVSESISHTFAGLYMFISVVAVVIKIFQRQLSRPTFTLRAVAVSLLTIVSVSAIPFVLARVFLFNHPSLYLYILPAPTVALFVFITSFPANYLKRRTIIKAKAKMASLPNLKVIGITGSYGKSSVKEFLAQILSTKYKVYKTPANQNTEIGVAQSIIYNLKSEDEVFVVEMGAYRVGEIKAICDIVHPTIGVLTAVAEQHLALFGSLEETKKAKYELIESLPEDTGVAIFNADNRATRELAEQTLKQKRLYSTERPADVTASEITVEPERLSFIVSINKQENKHSHILENVRMTTETKRCEVNLLGRQNVSSLLAAITTAHTLGMTLEEIAAAVKEITPLNHTLKPFYHKSGALILDDSYSANPDGVLAALDYLKLIPRKYKVLVMMPMIELGSAAKDAHRKVGERIGEVCDLAIFTQKNFFSTIRKASKLPNEKILVLSRPQSILNALVPYLNENSVILLENRIPSAVLKSLM